MEDKEFQEFLKTKTCRGCFNHCPLNNPNCNRSKIFIKEDKKFKFIMAKKFSANEVIKI